MAVGIGSVLALWLVAALAITGGRGLLRILPMRWISRLAALVMVVLAADSAMTACVHSASVGP